MGRRTGVAWDNSRDHSCSVAGEYTGPDQPFSIAASSLDKSGALLVHDTVLCTRMLVGMQARRLVCAMAVICVVKRRSHLRGEAQELVAW